MATMLLLFISAIMKMNVQSLTYFGIIVLQLYNVCGHGHRAKTSFIMISVAVIMVLRLFLIWSNIDEK